MRENGDFEHILDLKLQDARFTSSARSGLEGAAGRRPGPVPVFLFGDAMSGFSAGPSGPGAPPRQPAWTAAYVARPAAPTRPARQLSPARQQALDYLRGAGAASLRADSTDAEIKSAFRALVRHFHPDRHPGSSESERARLARQFAGVCDAYRTLTSIVH